MVQKTHSIWLSNTHSALFPICLKTGISNTLFSSSKLGDDISQIACVPEMPPVNAAGMGQGSVTTYGNSKSIADKARRLFHSAARSRGWDG